MRPARHKALVDKAVSACLAAIEIYNKPLFPHREEVFAIMMTNAWELLLKARVLQSNKNRMNSIYEMETPRTKAGQPAKRPKVKKSQSGNPRTITLGAALGLVSKIATKKLPQVATDNIRALEEIRNNSIHFVNADKKLRERVWELGTGSLKNFMRASQDWFGCDFSDHRMIMMPLAFVQPTEVEPVPTKSSTTELANLEAFLDGLDKRNAGVGVDQPFVMGVRLEVKLVGSRHADAPAVRVSNDPNAAVIRIAEDDWKTRFPLNYEALMAELKGRYSDFKMNAAFYKLKAELEKDGRFANARPWDPFNAKSQKKTFYARGIIDRFDAHYTRKSKAA